KAALRGALAWVAPALLLPLPWWWRNVRVYGLGDPLGLERHDAIVTGQPRTADWIAQFGLTAYLERLGEFTFKSFWGVFGWLGVFLDGRVYALLGLVSLLVAVGLLARSGGWPRLADWQRRGLGLLGFQAVLVAAGYAWYNLTFVQHQGRYLFPALLPLAIAFALGWQGLHTPRGSLAGAVLAAVAGAGLLWTGWRGGDVDGRAVLVTAVVAAALAGQSRRRLPPAVWDAIVPVLLVFLAVYALFGAIVPQLGSGG
ncbi:MAG: hypothetical protein RMN24_09840, partial [Anaerolineae bacterium]|nr:hypothetical protein [Anaerolineae bacterium]